MSLVFVYAIHIVLPLVMSKIFNRRGDTLIYVVPVSHLLSKNSVFFLKSHFGIETCRST